MCYMTREFSLCALQKNSNVLLINVRTLLILILVIFDSRW
jgi:hypothetical protein